MCARRTALASCSWRYHCCSGPAPRPTPPEKVAAYLERYPALWCEPSYRYGIADGNCLTPEWKRLFERHPDRFLLGSDTWTDQRWDSYAGIMGEYRSWLAQLPTVVAEKIAFRNAERKFRR